MKHLYGLSQVYIVILLGIKLPAIYSRFCGININMQLDKYYWMLYSQLLCLLCSCISSNPLVTLSTCEWQYIVYINSSWCSKCSANQTCVVKGLPKTTWWHTSASRIAPTTTRSWVLYPHHWATITPVLIS